MPYFSIALNLQSSISFFAFLIALPLSIFIFTKNPKALVNRSFSIFVLLMAIWLFTNGMVDASRTNAQALFWTKAALVGPALIPPTLLFFSAIFPTQTKPLKIINWVLLYLPAAITLLLVPTSLNVESFKFKDPSIGTSDPNNFKIIFGPLYTFFTLYFLTYVGVILYKLFSGYKKSTGLVRKQIFYVFLGLFGTILIAITTNAVLPLIGYSQLSGIGTSSSLILIGFVTYAIIRHRLMEIEIIIRRSVIYSTLLASLIVIYSVIVFGLNRLFLPTGGAAFPRVTDLIAIVIVAFTVDPLRRFIEKATDRIFFKARYDAEEAIKNISETISEVLDLNQLLNSLRLTFNRTLKVNKIAIYVKADHRFEAIDNFGGFDKSLNLGLEKKYFLNKYFKDNQNLVVTEELTRALEEKSSDNKDLTNVVKFLKESGVEVIAPLIVKDQLTGAIFLGEKLSQDVYSNEDIQLLEILSRQASIALENARLYQEQKRFGEKLQQEVLRATTDLRTANERLKVLDKAKDEFVSVVSHELRTPMTAIKSYVWLALNGKAGEINDRMRNYLSKVYQSSERLIGLINDVLDVSHIETGRIQLEIQPASPVKVAEDVVTTLEARAAEQKIKLKLEKDAVVPMVWADPMKLNEIFVNLVGNALKFTPGGGSITVSFAKQKDFVETSVTDTGIGISKEDLAKLFTKFGRIAKNYSTIAQSTGSGLGLYITKNYLDMMGGKIWVNSEINKGTTFTFSLPVAKNQKIKTVEKEPEYEFVPGHNGRKNG